MIYVYKEKVTVLLELVAICTDGGTCYCQGTGPLNTVITG